MCRMVAHWRSRFHTDSYTASRRPKAVKKSPRLRLGGAVAVSSGSTELSSALDLILQPLLLETLVAIGEGQSLEDALAVDTDIELLGDALHRLAMIRAIDLSKGPLLGRHALTERGVRLLRLLDDLDAAIRVAKTSRV
jgi:hypothetical protein